MAWLLVWSTARQAQILRIKCILLLHASACSMAF